MIPLYYPGDIVLVSFFPYLFLKPQIGDIIVFKNDKRYLIKKIGKRDNDRYFVVGENAKDSIDSRQFGWIEKNQIIGKVIYTFDKHDMF